MRFLSKQTLFLLLLGISFLVTVSCTDSNTPQKTRIAVIPKGNTHAFWKSVQAGAEQAAKELDVEIV